MDVFEFVVNLVVDEGFDEFYVEDVGIYCGYFVVVEEESLDEEDWCYDNYCCVGVEENCY